MIDAELYAPIGEAATVPAREQRRWVVCKYSIYLQTRASWGYFLPRLVVQWMCFKADKMQVFIGLL